MTTLAQRCFAGGELSPAIQGRTDVDKYQFGLKTCRNMFVRKEGGVSNRPGTQFVCKAKYGYSVARLENFEFNDDQTYVMEFGEFYIRFIKNGVQLTFNRAITGVSHAAQAVITSTAHTLNNGQLVNISGVGGATGLNGNSYYVELVDANSFKLRDTGTNVYISTLSMGTYTSGGFAAGIYEVKTPYTDADIQGFKFVQSADVVTIVHPNYPIAELKRFGDTSWTYTPNTGGFINNEPRNINIGGNSTTGTRIYDYMITGVFADGTEGAPGRWQDGSGLRAFKSIPITPQATVNLTWAAPTGTAVPVSYNVYRREAYIDSTDPAYAFPGFSSDGNVEHYGFIGVSSNLAFQDIGFTPDMSDNPPKFVWPFDATGNYPSTVGYYQQRLSFANTVNKPEQVWMSDTGNFKKFYASTPSLDSDSINFNLAGRKVNAVQHLLDLGKLVMLTQGGEYSADLDGNSIKTQQQTYYGSAQLSPVVVGGNAIYLQKRGNVIRDLAFTFESNGYRGNDLTAFSAHLFKDYIVFDWAIQQIPNSILWVARNDGMLLGLTYIPEQQIIAWHRHDLLGGFVESVTTIAEGAEDAVYLSVRRYQEGNYYRYIERMSSRRITDPRDFNFTDCSITFDGRNKNTNNTVNLTGGTTWAYGESFTLTSAVAQFSGASVGEEIHLFIDEVRDFQSNTVITPRKLLRLTITGYTSATVVTVTGDRDVIAPFRSTDLYTWARAIKIVTGLSHINGLQVSVLGDGFVLANPNDPLAVPLTVTTGSITLPIAAAVIHVGLPIVADIETLDVDTPQGETLMDKQKIIGDVTLRLEQTRGVWAGPGAPKIGASAVEGLDELKIRNLEGYDDPVSLFTGKEKIIIRDTWNSKGHVFIRQVDPLPITILAIAPNGEFPVNG